MGILSGAYDAVAGTADHLAGSTDEAFARQFDDEPGGGFADVTGEAAGDAYDATAGVFDHLAGSTDEAFARQFDDEPGGGTIDVMADTAAGVADYAAGSTDEAFARQFDDEPGGGFLEIGAGGSFFGGAAEATRNAAEDVSEGGGILGLLSSGVAGEGTVPNPLGALSGVSMLAIIGAVLGGLWILTQDERGSSA